MKYSFLFKATARFAIALLIGLAAVTSARADNLYARIHGTVTDSTGAVLPGVTVVAGQVPGAPPWMLRGS